MRRTSIQDKHNRAGFAARAKAMARESAVRSDQAAVNAMTAATAAEKRAEASVEATKAADHREAIAAKNVLARYTPAGLDAAKSALKIAIKTSKAAVTRAERAAAAAAKALDVAKKDLTAETESKIRGFATHANVLVKKAQSVLKKSIKLVPIRLSI